MGICIFEGIMDAPMHVNILEQTLLPFIPRREPFHAGNSYYHSTLLIEVPLGVTGTAPGLEAIYSYAILGRYQQHITTSYYHSTLLIEVPLGQRS